MSAPGTAGTAAPSGVPGELASYGERIIAALIDGGVLLGVWIVFAIVATILAKIMGLLGMLVYLAFMVVYIGYFIYLWTMDNPLTGRGQTIGKKVMKIKIVKEDGSDMQLVDGILRLVGYAVSGFVIYLGFIWIFIDANNQGWHDKIAKTFVIKA